MQSEAYKLTGFTVVVSALGFLLRWLQDMQIIDPETGLATPGAGISVVLTVVIVAAAAVLGLFAYRLGRYNAPSAPEEALEGGSFLFTAVCLVPAVILLVSGLVQILQANAEHWPESQIGVHRLCGFGTVAAAAGVLLVVSGLSRPERETARRIGAGLLILFGGLWLISMYKSAAADPVIWRFAVEILAICAALMAFYQVAGYFFGEPSPRLSVFFCHLGGFLCIMSAVDEHTLAETMCYGAVAILLLFWGFTLVSNFRPGPKETDASAAE